MIWSAIASILFLSGAMKWAGARWEDFHAPYTAAPTHICYAPASSMQMLLASSMLSAAVLHLETFPDIAKSDNGLSIHPYSFDLMSDV